MSELFITKKMIYNFDHPQEKWEAYEFLNKHLREQFKDKYFLLNIRAITTLRNALEHIANS